MTDSGRSVKWRFVDYKQVNGYSVVSGYAMGIQVEQIRKGENNG